MESTEFNRDPLGHTAWNPLHSLGIHFITLHGIPALNLDAWNPLLNWYQLHNSAGNPLHSIGICCRMLHGFHCMQPGYIAPRCMQSTAFTLDVFHNAAWNLVHSIIPHVIQCINQDQLGHGAWNPLHSIRIHWAKLHAIHCIHSGCISHCCMESSAFNHTAWNPCIQSVSITPSCMESTSFNRDTMHHSALNPLHSIMLHGIHSIQSGSIGPHCMDSTAFTRDPFHNAGWKPLH